MARKHHTLDLTGKRFGRLLVREEKAEPYVTPSGKKYRVWHCVCDCGAELDVLQNALTGKRGTRSCGCARRDAMAAIGEKRQNFRVCVVCGNRFACPPSDKTITCSPECRAERKRRLYTGRKLPQESIDKRRATVAGRELTEPQKSAQRSATAAALKSPIAGPFETNRCAKHWILKSPEGVLYEFDNLALFVRQHPDFFPNRRAAETGISAVAACMSDETTPPSRRPPRGRPVGSYKGWQVISHTENNQKPKED